MPLVELFLTFYAGEAESACCSLAAATDTLRQVDANESATHDMHAHDTCPKGLKGSDTHAHGICIHMYTYIHTHACSPFLLILLLLHLIVALVTLQSSRSASMIPPLPPPPLRQAQQADLHYT